MDWFSFPDSHTKTSLCDQRHEAYMARALDLARRGAGYTSPNPAVGAVVVRAGQIVGEGYHRRAGAPHAETEALRQAGEAARGATMYVTLEPCNHYGRTSPCTEAIITAGVAELYYAVADAQFTEDVAAWQKDAIRFGPTSGENLARLAARAGRFSDDVRRAHAVLTRL